MFTDPFRARFLALGLLFALGGCGALSEGIGLPASGPEALDVNAGRSDTSLKFGLVKLTPEVVSVLHEFEPKGYAQLGLFQLAGAFTDRSPPSQIRFGVGDVVTVTIF